MVALDLVEPLALLRQLLVQLRDAAVAQLAGALQVAGAAGGLFFQVGLLDLLVQLADAA